MHQFHDLRPKFPKKNLIVQNLKNFEWVNQLSKQAKKFTRPPKTILLHSNTFSQTQLPSILDNQSLTKI